MYSNFTGNSRRLRNVNLSGQRTTNPWANSGWSAAPSGASQTVANAQAEREKRHRERAELAAAKNIQRTWRGHTDRKYAKDSHRKEWDELYNNDDTNKSRQDRVSRALPLLLSFFDASSTSDQHRLDRLVSDLLVDGLSGLKSGQWNKLASILMAALEKRPITSSQHLLRCLVDVIKAERSSVTAISDRYYRLLSHVTEQIIKSGNLPPPDEARCHLEAMFLPLSQGDRGKFNPSRAATSSVSLAIVDIVNDISKVQCSQVYTAYAFSYLTAPLSMKFDTACGYIQLEVLSRCIKDAFEQGDRVRQSSKRGLLWLLAHFIQLNRASPRSQGMYLEALCRQLSVLAPEIRKLFSHGQDEDGESSEYSGEDSDDGATEDEPLPSDIKEQLEFLVNEDGISELLSRFTPPATSPQRFTEEGSLLADYTLTLLQCFPSHADDIKMRLFQGDIAVFGSEHVAIPAVRYFWLAMTRTEVFRSLSMNTGPGKSLYVNLLQPGPVRDQEWRTVMLFLELYNFLLRVTDDEDFLPANENVAGQSAAVARIRSSGLNIQELTSLVTFLKHLTFPLWYNLSDILPSTNRPVTSGSLVAIQSSRPAIPGNTDQTSEPKISNVFGIDIFTLRRLATATMRSLYERDSRRPFLPKDFWHLIPKNELDAFLHAVIVEEQRKNVEDETEDEDDELNNSGPSNAPFHTSTYSRLSHVARIESQRRVRRAQKDQLLAGARPRLEILKNMPFAIPFELRVQIFRQFVHMDKLKRRGGHVDPDRWRLSILGGNALGHDNRGRSLLGRHSATIKRGQVFDDAYLSFFGLGEALKEPIQITFVDQFDQPEAGIDGGGVTKEFLTSVMEEAFSPGRGMFVGNSQNLVYPNPTAFEERIEILRHFKEEEGGQNWTNAIQELHENFEFLGRIVGKCMYEGILIDIAFAPFFLLKWASSDRKTAADYRATLNDLRDLDAELYKGLINLKNYPGDVADMSLDFTITDQITNPENGNVRTITRPLRKDGENIPVTNQNRPLYISHVVHHRLVAQPYRQTKAFLRGLGCLIDPSWLSMFNQSELQRLVGGDSSKIDVEDLRRNTEYSGLYVIGDDGLEHPTVQMFWQVMRGLDDSERREVLKYVTSTPRAPLLGFSQLSPRFSIRDGGDDEERLPSTSTCVNLLKLPRYSTAQKLREKLLYAVQAGAGFDLS